MHEKYSFIAVGDVHVGCNLFNLPELGHDILDKYSEAVELAIEKKVTFFISLGDLFDTNKPTSEQVHFITAQNFYLTAHGITPLALSGDHSKSINGKTWEQVAGFRQPNVFPQFISEDYNDDPSYVIDSVVRQLHNRKEEAEFLFLHGQLPELFGFCSDKKRLILPWGLIKEICPNLKNVIAGDIHSGVGKTIEGIDVVYTGSLGVTKLDETDRKKILYYDGSVLNHLPSPLTRNFYELKIDEQFIAENHNPENLRLTWEGIVNSDLANTGKKPVIIIRHLKKYSPLVKDFDYLHKIAIVKNTLLAVDKTEPQNINIRSELSQNLNFDDVLKEMLMESNTFADETLMLGSKLLSSIKDNSTKDILNTVKQLIMN